MNQVVSSLLAGSGEEAMWQESEGFSMERERLERRYYSLQLQRERLHNCLLQTNSGTSTLRDAVNKAATSTLSDAALSASYFNNLWQLAAQQQWSYVDKKKRDGTDHLLLLLCTLLLPLLLSLLLSLLYPYYCYYYSL